MSSNSPFIAKGNLIPAQVLLDNALRKAPKTLGTLTDVPIGSIGQPVTVTTNTQTNTTTSTTVNPTPAPIPAQPTYSQAIYNEFDFTGQMFLPADPKRVYLIVQNQGGGTMYFSTTATGTFTSGIQIAIGGYYEPNVAPTSQIGISGTGVIISGSLP